MPFVEITERVSSQAAKAPASIRLRRRKGGKPGYVVGLRRVLMGGLGWQDCDVTLMIGSGEDAGKIRLRKVKTGKGVAPVRVLKSGTAVVDLGFVEAFGMAAKAGTGIDAKAIDDVTIELTLPDWTKVKDDVADDNDDQDDDESVTATPVAPAIPPQAAPARGGGAVSRAQAAVPQVEKSGVIVRFHPSPTIVCDGEGLQLTYRQARFLGALVVGLGGVILTADIIHKMDLASSAGAAIIASEYQALESRLPEIGLKLRCVPKMGYSLSKE